MDRHVPGKVSVEQLKVVHPLGKLGFLDSVKDKLAMHALWLPHDLTPLLVKFLCLARAQIRIQKRWAVLKGLSAGHVGLVFT